MPEPTSTLTFGDLILEVARKLGYAYYGENGDEALQVPVDPHDLAECKRHVNNGIRMFVTDGPAPNGWRWARPVSQIDIWGDLEVGSGSVVTGSPVSDGKTLLTDTLGLFLPTMELKDITITGVGTFTIAEFISPTQVKVTGDASAAAAATWAMTSGGTFTLPATFGGDYVGEITYAANTNQGVNIDWVNESIIRDVREDVTDETGDPYWAAIRPILRGDPRRRWELVLYPSPDENMSILFPFNIHFDRLLNLSETHPAPFSHDETVKAACLAAAERDQEDAFGPDTQYYRQVCLPNSYRIDAMSAPKRLGYFGNPVTAGRSNLIQTFRAELYQRPDVTFNA